MKVSSKRKQREVRNEQKLAQKREKRANKVGKHAEQLKPPEEKRRGEFADGLVASSSCHAEVGRVSVRR